MKNLKGETGFDSSAAAAGERFQVSQLRGMVGQAIRDNTTLEVTWRTVQGALVREQVRPYEIQGRYKVLCGRGVSFNLNDVQRMTVVT